MYDELASFRQRMNAVPHIEPTGDERFGDQLEALRSDYAST
jgi:hypothetical protein